MSKQRVLSPEQVEEAKAMRALDMTLTAIAQHFGVNHSTIRYWMDPEGYALNRAQRILREKGRTRTFNFVRRVDPDREPKITPDMLPPRDTRDLTARILGDPLPGRSALDRKLAQVAHKGG